MMAGAEVLSQASDEHLLALQTCLKEAAEDLKVPDLFDVMPKDAVKRFKELKERGKPVGELLLRRAEQCKLSTRAGSMGPVNSAMKCWVGFAKNVLDYPDGQELPPRTETDVAEYVAIFRNAGTAANYVGVLKWHCLIQSLDVGWATTTLKLQLKGLKKLSLAQMAGKLVTEPALLTQEVMLKVAAVARKFRLAEFVVLHLFCWLFLSRVQSEALPLEAGCEEDFTGDLPSTQAFGGHGGEVPD